jgi:hypothetical protein
MNLVRNDPEPAGPMVEMRTVLLEVFVPPRLNRQRLTLPPGFTFLMNSRILRFILHVPAALSLTPGKEFFFLN